MAADVVVRGQDPGWVALPRRWYLYVFLCVEAARGSASPWAPYLATAPAVYDDPVWYGPRQRRLLRGTPLATARTRDVGLLVSTHRAIFPSLYALEGAADIAPPASCTLARLRWARSLYLTRCFPGPSYLHQRQHTVEGEAQTFGVWVMTMVGCGGVESLLEEAYAAAPWEDPRQGPLPVPPAMHSAPEAALPPSDWDPAADPDSDDDPNDAGPLPAGLGGGDDDTDAQGQTDVCGCLLPLLDMLNHGFGQRITWLTTATAIAFQTDQDIPAGVEVHIEAIKPAFTSTQSHTHEPIHLDTHTYTVSHSLTRSLILRTTGMAVQLTRRGGVWLVEAQVMNNYGAKGNEELLRGYGFALRENAADVVFLRIGTSGALRHARAPHWRRLPYAHTHSNTACTRSPQAPIYPMQQPLRLSPPTGLAAFGPPLIAWGVGG
jgi:hypothetical protein